MASVQARSSAWSSPREQIAMAIADICSSATTHFVVASTSQPMSAPASDRPYRLALSSSTASGINVQALREVRAGERVWQQGAKQSRPLVGDDQQPGAAGLQEQLPAPAAPNQPRALRPDHADR